MKKFVITMLLLMVLIPLVSSQQYVPVGVFDPFDGPLNVTTFWNIDNTTTFSSTEITPGVMRFLINAGTGASFGNWTANGPDVPIDLNSENTAIRLNLLSFEVSGGDEIGDYSIILTDNTNQVVLRTSGADFNIGEDPDLAINITAFMFPDSNKANVTINDLTFSVIDISLLDDNLPWYLSVRLTESDANTEIRWNFMLHGSSLPQVILNTPDDNSFLSDPVFDASFIAANFSLVNSSLYVYDAEDNLILTETKSITGFTNQSTFSAFNFIPDNYFWNVEVCDSNVACNFAPVNFTFAVGVENLSINYNGNTVETFTESFNFNFTYNATEFPFVSALFNYNGTESLATNTGVDGQANFTSSLQVPLLPSGIESELRDFYWTITLQNFTGSQFMINTTTNQQNVSEFTLVECNGVGNPIINFTAAREDNLTVIDPFRFEGSFEINVGSGTLNKELSIASQVVSSISLCLTPASISNITISSAQIVYDGPTPGTFVERDLYIQEEVFMNSTTVNKTLYLLDAADATSFILVLQDQNIIPITQALITIERYYPGLDEFRTVQVARTDDDGKSVGFYKTETVDYRHTITKAGELLLQTAQQKIVGGEVPFTLTFTVGEIVSQPLITFEDIENLDATLFFNSTTGIVTFIYEDFTGNLTLANLLVQKVNPSTSDTIICNVNATTQAGILLCDISAFGDGAFIAQAFIARSPGILAKAIQFFVSSNVGIFGTTGLFLAWIIILSAAMIGIWNPTVGVIITNVAIILVNIIGLATFQPIFIFSMIGVSLILVILLKT